MKWTVVVPLKPLQLGKSRLRGWSAPADGRLVVPGRGGADPHEAMVLAFARDTLAAVVRCDQVGAVLLVCDPATASAVLGRGDDAADLDSAGELTSIGAPLRVVLDDPPAGLNRAVEAGERAARAAHPHQGIAALSADLPSLTPEALGDALGQAERLSRSFCPDRPGEGTTMLCANAGHRLRPQFGPGSAAAHAASGAVPLDALAQLRTDVDTPDDLAAAMSLGVGRSTASLGLVHLDGG